MSRSILSVIVVLFFCVSCSQKTLSQEESAIYFINKVEENKIDSALMLVDDSYLKKHDKSIVSFLKNFINEYKTLETGTERGVTLVMPQGFNVYRFRYFKNGTELQLDVIYPSSNKNSKLTKLEMIDRRSFQKARIDHLEPYPIVIE